LRADHDIGGIGDGYDDGNGNGGGIREAKWVSDSDITDDMARIWSWDN
jgi:hypothetical protein